MKNLRRSIKNSWVGGVFGGLAERYYFNADVLRILYIILFGIMPVLVFTTYIFLWYFIPEEDEE